MSADVQGKARSPRMRIRMQGPIIIFDHVRKLVTTVQTGPRPDKRVAELLAAQRKQIATSGRPK